MYALHFTYPGPSFLQDAPGAVGSFSAPGDQVNRPSRSGTDRRMFCFCMFFLLGFLVEEIPCEHGENMQTPHRKAWEITHLSLGRTYPPGPTVPHAGIEPKIGRAHVWTPVTL